jgi:hypothetical protein
MANLIFGGPTSTTLWPNAEPLSQSDLDRLAELVRSAPPTDGIVPADASREFVAVDYNPGDKLNGYIVCDPRSHIAIGWVKHGWPGTIEVVGQWCPGKYHPYWPPTGDPKTKYPPGVNANKWCAIVIVCAADPVTLQPNFSDRVAFAYNGNPIALQAYSSKAPAGVWAFVAMNDDDYRDNFNHPTDPMRSRIY